MKKTIYICYLIISDEELKKEGMFESRYLTYDNEKNRWLGIYGITDDKKIFNKFMKMRNSKYFIPRKLECDSDQFNEYMCTYGHAKIKNYKLTYKKEKSVKLPLSKTEALEIIEEYSLNISYIITKLTDIDYLYFNDKIKSLLNYFCYSEFHDIYNETDPDRNEQGYWNQSFNSLSRLVFQNQLNVFLWIYKKYLNIENINEIIKEKIDE